MVTTLFTGGDHASHIEFPVLAKQPNLPGHLPILVDHLGSNADDTMSSYNLSRDLVTGATKVTFQMGPDFIGCEINENDPAHAALTLKTVEQFQPLDKTRTIESRTEGALRSTADSFLMDITCTLSENGKVVRARNWKTEVKRQFV